MEMLQDHNEGHTVSENQVDLKSGFRIEGGRRYHDRDDVAYVLPEDDEENDRIHIQHWLLKATFNGNFSAPVEDDLDKGILVLDSGCGPGTWTLEMAKTYPSSTFYGMDIATRFPEAIKPANCQFQVHNLLNTNVFPENHFGFIHQRLLIVGILKNDWEKVITEYVRTLAPGGWLECTEVAMALSHNIGPKYQVLLNAFNIMCQARGLFWDIADHLEDLFKSAGLVNIGYRVAGGSVDDETQLGKLGWEDFKGAFMGLKPVVSKAMTELETDESYQIFLDEVRQECIERNTLSTAYRIWGQKPLVANEEV